MINNYSQIGYKCSRNYMKAGENMKFTKIKVSAQIKKPLDRVWRYYTDPEHVMQWNHASDDWHCPHAENDLREGGRFCYTMASKDGKAKFDFEGVYTKVEPFSHIAYALGDGREVTVDFTNLGHVTEVVVDFDAEGENTLELQRNGWQEILNHFKNHVEG